MATLAGALPQARSRPHAAPAVLGPVLLLAAAFVLRWPHLGDPLYDLDEQWYLFVGDRVRHGALPYVDLWDRKPVGLFLLYAALAWPGHAVVAYQLGATLAAGSTAIVIARLAEPQSDRVAGIAAGLAYLAWLDTLGGGGGQSPVFYNLPMALAALATLRAAADDAPAAMWRGGIGAMLLVGLALQIKYTVAIEGVAFGLVLAASGRRRLPPQRWAAYVAALIGAALLPTASAMAGYALLGQLNAFCYANFVSILARGAEAPAVAHARLGGIALQFLGFVPCWLAAAAALRDADPAVRRRQALLFGWLVAAAGGVACVGTFFYHYGLPLFVPACVAAAPAFRARPSGRLLAAALVALPVAQSAGAARAETIAHRAALARLVALVPAAVRQRCLAVLDGPPILYLATGACVPTRFAFPDHLLSTTERQAIGADRAGEIERLFARAPAAVAMIHRPPHGTDPASMAQMQAHLRAAYRLTGSGDWDGQRVDMWVRRAGG